MLPPQPAPRSEALASLLSPCLVPYTKAFTGWSCLSPQTTPAPGALTPCPTFATVGIACRLGPSPSSASEPHTALGGKNSGFKSCSSHRVTSSEPPPLEASNVGLRWRRTPASRRVGRGGPRAGPSPLDPPTPLSAVDSALSALSHRWLPLDMDIRSNRKSFLSRGITGLHGCRCRNAGCVCLGFVFFPRKTKQNKYGCMHTTHKGRKSNINLDTSALAQGVLSQ